MDHDQMISELAALREQQARLQDEVDRLREERIPHVDRSSRRRDRRLTIAYVLATAASVGFASVGSASALDGSGTVYTDDLVTNAVTSTKILDSTVAGADIKDGTVSTLDVRDESIGGADVAFGSLNHLDIADGGIVTNDISDGSLRGQDIAQGTVESYNVADESLRAVDIADGAVGSAEVGNGSINGEDLNLFNDNQCTGETVQGTAIINADPTMPSTPSTDWVGYAHSCNGGRVEVSRSYPSGQYVVTFRGNPARLAQVTPTDHMVNASVYNTGSDSFVVTLWTGVNTVVDGDFQILVY